PIELDLDAAGLTFATDEAEVEVSTNEDIAVQQALVTFVAHRPSEVNGEPVGVSENDDRYYVETSIRSPRYWFRGDKSTNNVLPNRGRFRPDLGLENIG